MSVKSKTARFPARVEKRRKVALANRETQLKRWTGSLTGDITFVLKRKPATGERKTFVEAKIALAQAEIATLKKHLRITT